MLKVDDLRVQEALGSSGADPQWAVAWKFPNLEATTRLAGIELCVGRTGKVGARLSGEGCH